MSKFKSIKTIAACLTILAVVQLSSCKKDEEHDHTQNAGDTAKPTISITSPSSMQVFYNGDTVKIRGLVSDASLHELLIKVVKDSDNSVLFSETPTVHDLSSYTINTNWKSQVTDHTNARVIVVAEDHSSNVSSDTVRIHIMP